MSFYEFFGYIGITLILTAYFMMQSGRWSPQELRVPLCNGIGALLILISLYEQPNMPSIMIEIIWVSISAYGVVRCMRNKKRHS
jgi:paired small multidrug resistance pump